MFSAALALGTGLLFGFFPAVYSTRADLVSTLKNQAGQPSGAKAAKRFRASLATAQVGLSMMLLVCAGLFIKSLYNVSRVDLGLALDNVITFGISPELNGYKTEQSVALFERLEDALKALPGVTAVSAGTVPLLSGSNWGNSVRVQGFEAGPDTDTGSRFNITATDYFRTLGVPLLAGREFTPADAKGAPKVAIVNEAFAKKFNLGRDAVGKRMAQNNGKELDIEIIGLVQNAKYSEVKAGDPAAVLFALPADRAHRPHHLLRAHVARRRADARGDPAARGEARSESSDRRSPDDAAADQREHLSRADDEHDVGVVCGARDAARGRSASTACSPTRSPSGRARSACAWRSAPIAAACGQWC